MQNYMETETILQTSVFHIHCTENPKRFWAYQSKYKSKRLPSSVQHNGVKVYDAEEKAELLKNYSNSVFKIDNGEPLYADCFFCDFDGDDLKGISISSTLVKETLKQLKVGKSCRPDMISPRLLKECINSISSPLRTLFNKQLVLLIASQNCEKVAKLVTVFKCDDKEIVQNYRGIFLLIVVSKVFEKCIFSPVFLFFQPF